jgi:hypothetical protein
MLDTSTAVLVFRGGGGEVRVQFMSLYPKKYYSEQLCKDITQYINTYVSLTKGLLLQNISLTKRLTKHHQFDNVQPSLI